MDPNNSMKSKDRYFLFTILAVWILVMTGLIIVGYFTVHKDSVEIVEVVVEESVENDCKVSGCNNEICGEEVMITPCVYKSEFECYKLTKCKRINGKCGWETTEEFEACIQSNALD